MTIASSGWIGTVTANGRPTLSGTLSCSAGHRVSSHGSGDDGIYAGWRSDGQSIQVVQDRYGMFPLFRWDSPDGPCFSTDVQDLLERGADPALDFDAVSVFLRLGFFIGDDTPFASIRAVVPPRLTVPPARISRPAAVDGYIGLMRQAIRRRIPAAPYTLPLSGGRDSRHLLFELIEAGHPPSRCVTVRHFPPRGNDDVEIAKALCAKLRIPHVVLDQPRDRIAVERRKNVQTHFCTEEHAQFAVLAEYIAASTRETYDGIAGDVLSQSGYMNADLLALFRQGQASAVARFILQGHGNVVTEPALARLVSAQLYGRVPLERATARLEREIATHLDAVNPISSFYFWNRTRREIALAPFGLMRQTTAFAPYLDRDVFDFLASLPPELTMDRTLHTEAIATAFPAHEDIGYERRSERNDDAAAARALARGLIATTAGAGGGSLNRSALWPRLAWTAVTGSADRLWAMPFVVWLEQVSSR